MSEDEIESIQGQYGSTRIADYERNIMGLDLDRQAQVISAQNEKVIAEANEKDSTTTSDSDQQVSKPKPEQPSSDFSDVDPAERTLEKGLKPILAMTLTSRSKVDGHYVERPSNLTADKDWTLEYALADIPQPSRAWSLYEATKDRRRRLFEDLVLSPLERKQKELEELEKGSYRGRGRSAGGDEFIDLLRDMAQKGRVWRGEMDRISKEKGGEKHVLGGALSQASELENKPTQEPKKDGKGMATLTETEEDEGLHRYMEWLYGGHGKQ